MDVIKLMAFGPMRKETILNVFPTRDDRHRLVVAIEQEDGSSSHLVLRQETFSDDIGWFVQSRINVEPEQIAGLKMSLSGQTIRRVEAPAREVPRVPAILRFDRTAAGSVAG